MGNNLRRGFRVLSLVLIMFCLLTTLAPVSHDLTAAAAGEGVWSAQTSGFTRRLFTVFFFDTNNGWAVGEAGTFIRTTNGGATWVSQFISSNNLRGVFFIDSQIGWIVGDTGYIARSYDGGASWTRQEPPASNNFYAVRFVDLNKGLVVGDNGAIFQTSDGGASWSPRASGTGYTLDSLYFADVQSYWATADVGNLVRSSDAGNTWVTQQVVATQANLEKVCFPSPSNGLVVGPNGTIVSTADGGMNWTLVPFVTTNHLRSVFFTNVASGWVVGDNGTILDTSDGGKSWNLRSAGISSRLNDVYFVDSKNGWAVGDNGVVLRYSAALAGAAGTGVSLTQDIGESGAVKVYLNIDMVRDPSSVQPRQLLKGIGRVFAIMNFDGDGFSLSGFQGIAPFDKADIRVRNLMGTATYEVDQTEAQPQPPLKLAEFYPRITGSTSRTYPLAVNFQSIITRDGQEIPLPGPLSLTFRRGDANADGIIDAKDPLLIAQYLAGKAKKDDINLLNAASVYGDGPQGDRVTIKDAMILAQKVAGIRNDELLPATQFLSDMLAS